MSSNNPFTVTTSSSSDPFGGGWKITDPGGSANGLTARQLALILQAEKSKKHFGLGHNLLQVGKGALNPVLMGLDLIMRPSYAVTGAVNDGLSGKGHGFSVEKALSGAWKGLSGQQKMGFGQVMDNYGLLKHHSTLRGGLGFVSDVSTDPLMLASIALAPETGGGSLAAYTALKAGAKGASEVALRDAAKAAAYDAGRKVISGHAGQDAVDVLTQAGKGFEARKALAVHNLEVAKAAEAAGLPADAAKGITDLGLVGKQSILQQGATAEEQALTKFRPAFKYGTRKHNVQMPTRIGKVPITPILPKSGAIVAKGIPGVSHSVDWFAKHFISGYSKEALHAMEIGRQHTAESIAVNQRDAIKRIMGGESLSAERQALTKEVKKLTVDDQVGALHFMENPLKVGGHKAKSVLKAGKGHYIINEKYLTHLESRGWIDHVQAEYIRRFFDATQHMYTNDKAAGVLYKHLGEEGRMYVPHVMMKDGSQVPNTHAVASLLTDAGFMKKRATGTMSLHNIAEMIKSGELGSAAKNIETDPFKLLAHTSRARAQKQADALLVEAIKNAYGVPSRLTNPKRVAAAEGRLALRKAEHAGNLADAANKESMLHAQIELHKAHALSEFDKAIEQAKKAHRSVKFGRNKSTGKIVKQVNDMFDAQAAIVKKRYFGKNKAKLPEALAKIEEERAAALVKAEGIDKANFMKSKKMTLARHEKNIKHLESARKWTEDQLAKGTHPRLASLIGEQAKNYAESSARAKTSKQLVSQAEKSLKRAMRGSPNPAFDKKVLAEVKNAKDLFGNSHGFPREMAGTLERVTKIASGEDKTVEDFAKGWGKMMSTWKLVVTSVNPGYRIRNSMTDFWNMWVSGVPAAAIPKYGREAAILMRQAKQGDMVALAKIREAASQGILSGLYTGDVQAVAKYLSYEGGKKELMANKHFAKAYVKLMQDVNRNAENWGRLTHYLYRKAAGESAPDAARMVKLAHFDYEDLTPFEQKVMKKIFPFYTWTRKNVPFQVKMIFQHPGRYAAFPKLVNEATYAAGGDNQQIPGYLSDNLAFKIPGGKYLTPQFGVADLAPLQGIGQAKDRITQMLNPAFKIPAEVLTNKSIFTGQPIASDTHPRTPVSSLGEKVFSLLPGGDAGQTMRGGVAKPGANPWWAYAVGQDPMLRNLLVKSNPASYFGGISASDVKKETQQQYDYAALQKQVDKMLTGLRDEGKIPQSKRKKSKNEKYVQKQIFGN